MDKGDDPYVILGVPYDTDESKIKKAYFKLARQYHPDKQTTDEDKINNGAIFVRVSDAYDLLNDPVRRYDWKMANEGKMKVGSQHRPTGSKSHPTRSFPPMNPPRSSAVQSPPTRSSPLSPLAPRRTPQAMRPPYGSPNPRASSNPQHPADRSSMRPNRTSSMQNNHRPIPQGRPPASWPDYAPPQRQNTPNPFDVLGIHWNADRVEIISAYRIFSQKYHPSKQRTEESRMHAAKKMAEVHWAFETLKDPVKLHEWQLRSRGSSPGTPVRRHPLRDNRPLGGSMHGTRRPQPRPVINEVGRSLSISPPRSRGSSPGTPVRRHPLRDNRPLGGSMHGTRRPQPRPVSNKVGRSLSISPKSKGKSRKVSLIQKLGIPLNMSMHNKKEKKEKKKENKCKESKKPASFAWKREKSATSSNNSFGTVQTSDSSDSLLEEQESPIQT
jgi:curved DNA-binding protein CbpA